MDDPFVFYGIIGALLGALVAFAIFPFVPWSRVGGKLENLAERLGRNPDPHFWQKPEVHTSTHV